MAWSRDHSDHAVTRPLSHYPPVTYLSRIGEPRFFRLGREAIHEPGAQPPRRKSGSLMIFSCSGIVVLMPSMTVISSVAAHARDRFLPVAAVDDDLGDQRIVVRRDRALGVRARVDADAGAARQAERVMTPGDGAKVSGSSALIRHSMAWPRERRPRSA